MWMPRKKCAACIAIVTAADVDAAGVGSVTRHPPLPGRNGSKLVMPHRHALARERAMYVGETVAMVIAETEFAAQDAADLVEVDYEPLDPVVTMDAAQASGAPQLWPEAPGNLALDWAGTHPDPDANAAEVERIIASAKHVARVKVTQQRLTHVTMEPRGATARYDASSDGYHLRVCSQSAGAMRDHTMAVMNIPKEKLRVITEDVGGAFGMKTGAYPEYIAQLVGAKISQAPGALDGEPLGVVPQRRPRARHRDRGGACARRQRAIPGAAGAPLRQPRRLCRLGRRQSADAQFRALLPEHVRHQARSTSA